MFKKTHFIVGFFILIVLLIVVVLLSGCTEYQKTEKREIYSIGDTMSVSGMFCLGSGSINQKPVYVFYEKTENGSYVISWVNAYNAEIFMDENEHPYVITSNKCWDKSESGMRDRHGNLIDYCKVTYAEFHVPNGTVIQRYNLDAQ